MTPVAPTIPIPPAPARARPRFWRRTASHVGLLGTAALLLLAAGCRSRAPYREALPREWPQVHALVQPLPFPAIPSDAVDPATLEGKVMAGYQGWFVADDGSGLEWTHYGPGRGGSPRQFAPGSATIDLWPDMTEAGPTERYATPFRFADGRTAEVFTSRHPDTIDRHFRWMREHGIDGVFLQRFGSALRMPAQTAVRNQVLTRLRASAARHGRTWALMYDLSGMRGGSVEAVIQEDWRRLVDTGRVREDPRLQRHQGRPLVALWGIGFNDGRGYSLEECERLVRWLQEDPVYGGNAVLVGVPYYWRDGQRDAVPDAALQRICPRADIVSPWSVGRLREPADAAARAADTLRPDLEWTRARGVAYLPVIFPGFSWHNLKATRGESAPLNAIPRRGGAFLQAQADAAIAAGARMLYVAMFDELDEGTAVMKVTATPPVGASPFVAEPGVPPDHYLRLVGKIGAQLRRAVPASPVTPPRRAPVQTAK